MWRADAGGGDTAKHVTVTRTFLDTRPSEFEARLALSSRSAGGIATHPFALLENTTDGRCATHLLVATTAKPLFLPDLPGDPFPLKAGLPLKRA
jgi:hypothetical protein